MARILIVDDRAVNREFLVTLLGYKGHELVEASDGAEALASARSAHPDLIITDILMPTMDGYEFVRLLRTDPSLAHINVIFCTAHYLEHEARQLAQSCGVEYVLFKPCEPALVLQTVDAALGLIPILPVAPPAVEFDREHLQLLTNKLSHSTTELRVVNRRLDALIDINTQLSSEGDARRLLEALCRDARELIGAKYCAVAVGNGTPQTLEHFITSGIDAGIATEFGVPTLCDGTLGALLAERRSCRLRDITDELSTLGLPLGFPAVHCLLGVSIASLKRSYGWLCVCDKLGGEEFSAEDERLMSILGGQVGRIYENGRLYAEAQRHALALQQEIAERVQAQQKVQAQLNRLDLLQQITHAIGERQDLPSIFQVVLRSLEDHLPIDFGCVCQYDLGDQALVVTSVGAGSAALAKQLAMTESALVPIDRNGLSRCVAGQLVYESNIVDLQFPFPQRLASVGLRAFVAAPLLAENKVFGVLIAARFHADSFSSGDCEFLRQLSEHVALAAYQAQLYSAIQRAYNDLRQSHQVVMQQERLRALGQMASGVAHDINNAISPIVLYTESLLEQEPNLSGRTRSYLTTIRRAINDVADTVSRMRQFSRPNEPQYRLSHVGLNLIIEQVIDLTRVRWRDLPQQHGIVVSVQTELMPDLPDIMGIESEIRDAFTNLIFNAVDAMPEGGTLTIRTHAVVDRSNARYGADDRVQVTVQDTGIGMNETTRRHCLEPFFTTKGERGTGMGLAMVYGMAQRHDADIDIDSALGKGTTVRLRFAVATQSSQIAMPPQALRLAQSLRLLIVDDDPLIIESLQSILENDGHQVVAAEGGQTGIDVFQESERHGERFAVVLTDLGMPYIDGRTVAAAVKSISPHTPIVMLTGWGQGLADNDMPPHVDRVLSKPPKLNELRRVLAELAAVTDPGLPR